MIHDLSDSSAAPTSFGPFRVLHQIGVGVLGPVFRAQDSVRDQLVAVKAFKVDAPPEQAEEIADALRDVAHALPRHRGLLEYIASGVERSTPYLVMAHSDVPSLDTKLKPGVPLDAEAALDLIATLADAIDAAHAKGIIHGTLHPRDVFVDDRGGCRISGFGVATALAGAGIRAVPVRRPYSPPERVVGGPIERSADLFALGALAFELFSGRRVVGTGLDAAVRFAVSASDVDMEHLRTALAAMLAENPVHRPSSATAFAQAVTQAVRPRGLTPEAGRKRVTPSEIKMSAAGAAGAAGAAAAGAGAARAPESASTSSETLKLPQEQLNDPAETGDAPQSSDSDALALFTRQGTLWESNRPSEPETVRLETVTVAPDEDPLAQFSSESESAGASASAAPSAPAPAAPSQQESAREPEQPEPQPVRIHDESSDDEVKSIADAARAIAARGAAASVPLAPPAIAALTSPTSSSSVPATAAAAGGAAGKAAEDVAEDLTEPHRPLERHEFEYLPARGASPSSHVEPAFDAHASAASESAAERASASILAADRADTPHAQHTHAHDRFRDHPPGADHDRDHGRDHVLTGLRGWTPAEEIDSSDSGSNPLRVLVMVLAIGLAVGVAGGYLLGQRSALRQAFALFRGDRTSQSANTNGDAASGATPAADPSGPAAASSTPPTEVTEPTVVPEGSTPASPRTERQQPPRAAPDRAGAERASSDGAASRTPASRAASAAKAPAAASTAAAAVPTRGQLLVRSSPARAEVTVNGIRHGETPLTLRDLPFGTHTIGVTRNGYLPATRKVTLSASRNSESLEFDLEREGTSARDRERPGSAAGLGILTASGDPDVEHASAEAAAAGLGALYVLSHPAGARVLVDGQYVGSTPLLVTNVPPGAKTIKLELTGHKPWSSSVRVAPGQRVRVAASLEEGTN